MVEKSERFDMRVPPGFLDMIDDWRRKQKPIPSRAQAIRFLCEQAVSGGIKQKLMWVQKSPLSLMPLVQ